MYNLLVMCFFFSESYICRYQVYPYLNSFSISDCIWSLTFGRYLVMWRSSRIFLLHGWRGADDMIFHVNLWFALASRCFDGSDFVDGLSCSAHLIVAFLSLSPMYFSPQEHLPSYITVDLCWFLSLSGKRDLIFLVFQMILKMYLFCVYDSSRCLNFLTSVSLDSQNGRRIRTVCLSSNNQLGISSKSGGSRKSFITEVMNRAG